MSSLCPSYVPAARFAVALSGLLPSRGGLSHRYLRRKRSSGPEAAARLQQMQSASGEQKLSLVNMVGAGPVCSSSWIPRTDRGWQERHGVPDECRRLISGDWAAAPTTCAWAQGLSVLLVLDRGRGGSGSTADTWTLKIDGRPNSPTSRWSAAKAASSNRA